MWVYRGKRGHGSAAEPVSPPPDPSTFQYGDKFRAPWAATSINWVDNTTLTFAFWSVTGGIEGPIATPQNPPPAVTVGFADIMATAWYIAGGVNGEPGSNSR